MYWFLIIFISISFSDTQAASFELEQLSSLGYSDAFIAKVENREYLMSEIIRRHSKPIVFYRGISISDKVPFNPLIKGMDLVTFGTQDFSEAYFHAVTNQTPEKNTLVVLQYEVPDYLVEHYGDAGYLSIRDIPYPGMKSKILPGRSSDLAFFLMKSGVFPDQAGFVGEYEKKYRMLVEKNGRNNIETKNILVKFTFENLNWSEYPTCQARLVRVLARLARDKRP